MAGMLLQQAAPVAAGTYLADLLRSGLAVVAVALLSLAGLHWLRTRGFGQARARAADVQVLARVPLEPRKSLYVVRAGGRVLLLGAGEAGPPALILELGSDAAVDSRRLGAESEPAKAAAQGRASQAEPAEAAMQGPASEAEPAPSPEPRPGRPRPAQAES